MGFGLLFFGYLLLFPASLTFFYTVPIAALVLGVACYRLARVNRPFGFAFYAAVALFPCAILAIVLRLVPATVAYAHYAEAFCLAIQLVFTLLILTGIEWVAAETRLDKLRGKAFRNKIFTCIHLVPSLLLIVSDGMVAVASLQVLLTSLSAAMIVVGLVVLVLNAFCIYNAYVHICMPEDVDMAQKPSKFAFVNRRREEIARRQAQVQEERKRAIQKREAEQKAKERKHKK